MGIFGKRVALDHPLAPGDRVEIYRPLAMDPKEARRRRATGQALSAQLQLCWTAWRAFAVSCAICASSR